MAYAAFSVVFGEQPSAAKWNILGTNDASFNDGTGIGDATITPDHLATGAATAVVATSQTTTSSSYTDLATVGPAVTVTIGANGIALVSVSVRASTSTTGGAFMSYAVTGATTTAASTPLSVGTASTTAVRGGIAFLITGLAAGSTTFTAKYSVTTGTGTFEDRRIAVIPL